MRVWAVCGALLACHGAQADSIASARYLSPTDIYGHGALPGGEYLELEVTGADGATARLRYDGAVFEDTAPRVIDLDRDGSNEVVTVVSDFDLGARVQVFGLVDGALTPILSNTPIGTRFRWLAIAGIADLDGDGAIEIAYVDRPHLAKTLRILRVTRSGADWQIAEVASTGGLTNHKYRDPLIEGGVYDCKGGPAIVTANANWQRVIVSRLVGDQIVTEDVGTYSGPDSLAGCG